MTDPRDLGETGQRTDRYEIIGLIGQGGMARVFDALSRGSHGFERRVAIKQSLPLRGDDPVARAKVTRAFLDEARIASHLHHDGIVAVLDFGVIDDCPFQVLEHVDGWSLSSLLRRARSAGAPLPSDVALAIATEVAHALAYAHDAVDEKGAALHIVHRDVKPANVLVSKAGAVKLADFGIAHALGRLTRTTDDVVKGTYGYMAPEQLLGLPVDRRADVFALGCTLHALFAFVSPCEGLSPRQIAEADALPISPSLPDDVRTIVARAIEVDLGARSASAREVADALGAALAARLETDARSRIVAWLARLQPAPVIATSVPRVVLTAGTGSSGVRELATTMTLDEVALRSRSPGARAPDRDGHAAGDAMTTRAPSRRVVFVAAALIPLVLAAAAIGGAVVARAPAAPGQAEATPHVREAGAFILDPPSPSATSSMVTPTAATTPSETSSLTPGPTASSRAAMEPSCECVEYLGARPMRTLCLTPMSMTGCRCESSELGQLCFDPACSSYRFPPGAGACTGFRDGVAKPGTLAGCSVCYGASQRRAAIHGGACTAISSENERREGRWRCH
ncbi:MAG: serine/threonine protein kinase [Deltaproteobacteria bacterium]|nr:serine/threonine protein kinase [Deltaproteobacteria bacterium]